jgi:hypothetical protein
MTESTRDAEEDAAIAAYTAGVRRRNVRIFVAAGVVCIVIGLVLVGVVVTSAMAMDYRGAGAGDSMFSAALASFTFVAGGAAFFFKARKQRRGEYVPFGEQRRHGPHDLRG